MYYLIFCISIKLFIYYLISQKKFTFLWDYNINGAYKLKRLKFNNERIERYN